MDQIIVFILQSFGHFIAAFDFKIFDNGVTFLQFVLAVPIAIFLIKIIRLGFIEKIDNSDFSLFDNMKNDVGQEYVERTADFDRSGYLGRTETLTRVKGSNISRDKRYFNRRGEVTRASSYSKTRRK